MRSHSKASTAGSTKRQAKGLGRIFRGALATPDASNGAGGSSALKGLGPITALLRRGALPALALSLVMASSASGSTTHIYSGTSFGPDGTSGTSFKTPGTVAVDQQSHDVYVGDVTENANVIYKFNENGEAVNFSGSAPYIEANKITGLSFPGGTGENQLAVDPNSGTIYVNSRTSLRAFQPSGEPAEFTEGPGAGSDEIGGFGELLGLAVDQDGNIYAGDYSSGVKIFTSAGAALTSFPTVESGNLAVDSQGNVYVNQWHGSVKKFSPSEVPVTAATVWASAGTVDPNRSESVAVDPASDDLYTAEAGQIAQYDEAGNRYVVFAGGEEPGALVAPEGIAVDGASGKVFASDRSGDRRVEIFGPTVLVPTAVTGDASNIGKTSATVSGTVNPEGIELTSCSFEYGEEETYGQTAPCAESAAEVGTGEAPVEVHADLTGLQTSAAYHYRLVAANANGSNRGADKSFRTLSPPLVGGEQVASAASSEAIVGAKVNPEGSPATYHVEYGFDTSYGQSTAEKTIGSDRADRPVSVTLEGLAPGKTYHWRVVATNSIGTTAGTDHTFNTYALASGPTNCPNQELRTGPSALLPDCRAYEMVSPVDKNGGDVVGICDISCFRTEINQASTDGEKFTYSSYKAFGDALGGPFSNQYMAHRGPDGWTTHGISPPYTSGIDVGLGFSLQVEFKAFSADLSSGWLIDASKVPPTPEGVEGFWNVYRRDDAGGALTALTTAEPEFATTRDYGLQLEGHTPDGSHVIFSAEAALTPDATAGSKAQLYDYTGGELHLVSVLPDGAAIGNAATAGTVNAGNGGPTHGQYTLSHAISSDGSRIFWSSVPFANPGMIYVRLNADQPQSALNGSDECTEPAKACTLPVSSGIAHYWTASTDGSKALFNEGEHLQIFDVAAKAATSVAHEALGVLGASDDLSRIYFVSKEDLAAGATAGGRNLYLDSEGAMTYIATLSSDDASLDGIGFGRSSATDPAPLYHAVRVSPDGRHLAFMSTNSLTGYDNTDADNGEADSEVFAYDADAQRLSCVSCNPSGARAHGGELKSSYSREGKVLFNTGKWAGAWLSTSENSLYTPNALSEDGSRLFFNSFDALVPRDTNGAQDVYQWEALGSGDCTTQSAHYTLANDGCIGLISTGESAQDSEFVDATPDGSDVFFKTGSSIDPRDPGLIDVYDARVDGGYPPPAVPSPPCLGDACQGVPSAPNDPTASSASFRGAGDPPPRRARHSCRARKRHAKGSSKAKAKRKAAKSCKRANGRAGR